jgi:hypothetical protein
MAKTIAPIPDLKVQCHCALDTFVSRVDQRAKHSSGLAIHNPQAPPAAPGRMRREFSHKSQFYLAAEKAYSERGKPDEALLRNIARRKEAAKKLDKMRKRAVKKRGRWSVARASDLPFVDVEPDPILMAEFRYRFLIKFTPHELFGSC